MPKVQDRRELRQRLYRIAGQQSGLFTAAQAMEVGYSYAAQKYHVDHGNWARIERGIFRLREWPPGRHEDLIRWLLWSGGRGVVSHNTALSVYGLGLLDPVRADLTVPPGFRKKASGVRLHRDVLPEGDVRMLEGVRITTPLRSILDCATSLMPDELAPAVDDAIRTGLVTRTYLLHRADEFGARAALAIERVLNRDA